ncbi:katanin p60 ATPase-containing subunit A-like 2 isoform X7 [Falco rusticolus]|uniref:katanin p60 ATPase-containing subunit A-like 2 isoform X7 n=1 Tax=Falco rusticolus TaxID=120794 RepID=UPI001886764B|nr:katanin p60 ATPase-containing subunit A-like 2 isoform X7 [Falco rusticolus]XP_055554890.1 katanin p60 ATPase-containing subunit A-like 2 isoform X7 [Falco cherrug]
MELSCQTLRTTYQAREADEMRTEARRKNLLILILHYLMEEGYVDAANALEQETKLSLRGFEVCDNIDLETILMEYESYYFVKFKKYPKITKKVLGIAENKQLKTGGRPRRTASSSQNLPRLKLQTVQQPLSRTAHGNRTEFKSSTKEGFKQNNDSAVTLEQSDFGLSISAISKTGGDNTHPRRGQVTDFHGMIQDAVKVSSDGIALNSLNCDPDPSYPQLFTGILSPWKGLLLYGPPGTGKTLLAKAVATECNTTFFNISASTIVSKWRGDSEKLVRVLFELARYHAPSTIFLDELESVMSQRGTASGGEHEGSRRMKTELLVQMDGLARSDDLVFVLAASNLPWELDSAMLRRLEKRILVDLPSKEARRVMIQHWLPPLSNSGGVELRTDLDYSLLGQETDGYSGSDIKLVCKEAAMRPVRKIFDALENHQPGSSNLPMIQLDTITTADFLDVITHTKPSVKNLSQKYTAWQREFESV